MKFYRVQHKDTGIGPFNTPGYTLAFASGFVDHKTLHEQPYHLRQRVWKRFHAGGDRLFCRFAWQKFEQILLYPQTQKAITMLIQREFVVVEISTKRGYVMFPDGQVVYDPEHANETVIDWEVFKKYRKKLVDNMI